jgi:Peptidase family M23/N-acetylmuramoyl-L-alanine amidase
MSLSWPVIATVSQQFASNPNNIQPNGHTGMDFAVAVGTSVKAAGAGTVVYADWATKLSASNPWWIAPAYAGIVVVIDHGNGLLTLYAHLSVTNLNAGQRVIQGQEIGKSGSTGLSTGPHLHFEVLGWPLQPYNGFYGRLNPVNYVSSIMPASVTPLKANQRKAGAANVNLRATASTKGKILRVIPAGSVENFTGYYNGERVNGNNLWYRDAQGFAHSAGFTTVSATGLPNTTPQPAPTLKANERLVGADNVNLRAEPSTSAKVIKVLPAKSIQAFTAYVNGERVNGMNLWYKSAEGYAWCGGFTTQVVTGLPNQTPTPAPAPKPEPAPAPAATPSVPKKTGASSANVRSAPSTSAAIQKVLAPATTYPEFTFYVKGEAVDGNDIWFTDLNKTGYAWSGVFTDPKPSANMTEVAAPVETTSYTFDKDFDFVEYKPAHITNVQRAVDNPGEVVFPLFPEKAVIHQFDAKAKNPTLDGVINHFQTERPGNETSAHFGISGNRIVQFVSLKDRAYHAGKVGNDYIGIETDPQQDAATIESTKKLLRALKAKYGYELITILHKDVPGNTTNCGAEINLANYELNSISPTPLPPIIVAQEPKPAPTPVPTPAVDEEAVINEFLDYLKEEFFKTR